MIDLLTLLAMQQMGGAQQQPGAGIMAPAQTASPPPAGILQSQVPAPVAPPLDPRALMLQRLMAMLQASPVPRAAAPSQSPAALPLLQLMMAGRR